MYSFFSILYTFYILIGGDWMHFWARYAQPDILLSFPSIMMKVKVIENTFKIGPLII